MAGALRGLNGMEVTSNLYVSMAIAHLENRPTASPLAGSLIYIRDTSPLLTTHLSNSQRHSCLGSLSLLPHCSAALATLAFPTQTARRTEFAWTGLRTLLLWDPARDRQAIRFLGSVCTSMWLLSVNNYFLVTFILKPYNYLLVVLLLIRTTTSMWM